MMVKGRFKKFLKLYWFETVYMVVFIVAFIYVLCCMPSGDEKKVFLVSLGIAFLLFLSEVVFSCISDFRFNKEMESIECFVQIDDCYKKNKSSNETINTIQSVYRGNININDAIRRSSQLRYVISWPELSHEKTAALLPVVCTVIIALPSFIKTSGILCIILSLLIVMYIIMIMLLRLVGNKTNEKNELMRYELKQIDQLMARYKPEKNINNEIDTDIPGERGENQ